MSINVNLIEVSSKEDLYSRLNEILDVQIKNSIVGIRGVRLTEEEQLQLVRDLGDIAGWFPNNSEPFNHKYIENHSANSSVEASSNDELILSWHLERVDYDEYVLLVAGVWNMRLFNCDPESGKTYFIDSRKVFQKIYSEEEKTFLRGCRAYWVEQTPKGDTRTNYVNIVQPHWKTQEEQIRVELHHMAAIKLHKVNNNDPTLEEIAIFESLMKRFAEEVENNEDLRIIHKWKEGDILIPDLFSLAHAVTGGFDPKDREFTGYWCYTASPSSVGEDNVPPSWRGE